MLEQMHQDDNSKEMIPIANEPETFAQRSSYVHEWKLGTFQTCSMGFYQSCVSEMLLQTTKRLLS